MHSDRVAGKLHDEGKHLSPIQVGDAFQLGSDDC